MVLYLKKKILLPSDYSNAPIFIGPNDISFNNIKCACNMSDIKLCPPTGKLTKFKKKLQIMNQN